MIRIRHLKNSSLAGTEQTFERASVRIGRKPDCEVRFDAEKDLAVSGEHAEIRELDGGLVVRDLGSRNGTFVNGVRLAGQVALAPSDVVRLGASGPEMSIDNQASPVLATIGEPAPAKQGVGLATMQRAIDKATLDERATNRKRLRIAMLCIVFATGGGLLWSRQRQQRLDEELKRSQSEIEVARRDAEKARLESEAAKGAVHQIGTSVDATREETARLRKETEEAKRIASEARAQLEGQLESALAEHTRELAALKDQLSSGEKRVSELIVEIESRDSTLEEIRERQDLSEAERAALKDETEAHLAKLRDELVASQEALRKEATGASADWADLVERYKESLFLVVSQGQPDAQGMVSQGIGTAWVLRDDGVLGTNAHVAEMFEKPDTLSAMVAVQNSTGIVFDIKASLKHSKWGPVNSPDVGLIRIDTQGRTLLAMPTANPEQLRKLRIGMQLGTLGYPGELQDSYLSKLTDQGTFPTALATFKDGWVGRITDFENQVAEFDSSWFIQHSASLSGGTSGSPMFTREGYVVALNNSGLDVRLTGTADVQLARTPSASEIGRAIRVDLLQELLRDSGW